MSGSFAKFDTYRWNADKTHQTLQEIKRFYEQTQTPLNELYPPQKVSYVSLQTRAFARQHASFMMLQAMFLLAALCVFGLTYFF